MHTQTNLLCLTRRGLVTAAAAVLALAWCAGAQAFDMQGHRGARGLAPENSLPAFEKALAIGVHTLELDVGLTADDVVVIGHDPALNPAITRDTAGRWLPTQGPTIRSLTWQQLREFDVGRIDPASSYAKTFATQQAVDGTRMPRLSDLFELVQRLGASTVRFNIETKLSPLKPDETATPEVMVRELLKTIKAAGMSQRVSIQSFDWRTLVLVQAQEPSIPTVYLSIQTANTDNTRAGVWTAGFTPEQHGSLPKMVKAAGGRVWSPNGGALTQALVDEAQGLGLKVIPWTINNPADMQRFLDWRVDGLITDYPDRLRELMRSRGMPLPQSYERR
jgi:glycerophosphoryl diester phosphodiesterase